MAVSIDMKTRSNSDITDILLLRPYTVLGLSSG